MSAFVNNTPLVAVCLPVVNDWAKTVPHLAVEADAAAELRRHSGRVLHTDRHEHEPGGSTACCRGLRTRQNPAFSI